MLQSLHSRLLLTHLLVAIVAIGLVGVVSSQIFRHYYVNQVKANLSIASQDLARTFGRIMTGPRAQEQVTLLTGVASRSLGGRVCVFGQDAENLLASSDLKTSAGSPRIGHLDCEAPGPCIEVETGVNTCHPGAVITTTVPILAPQSERRIGMLHLRRPLREVETTLRTFTWIVGGSGALATALALFFAMLISRAIAKPLHDMAWAASNIADGDFSTRLQRTGPLELRTVAASLNHMAGTLASAFSQLSSERERLADILAGMTEGVLGLDVSGQITTANQSASRLLDVPMEQLLHHNIKQVAWLEQLTPDITLLLTGDKTSLDTTLQRQKQWLGISATRLAAGDGGIVVVIADVTESERLEQLRREFIANASHELRAPLTSIQGFLGAMSDGTAATEEARQRCIRIALEQAKLMRRLVDQLLDLSRLQAGVARLEKHPVQLTSLLQGAIEAFTPQAKAREVEVTFTADKIPEIQADGSRLMQVITNLLDNAIRHTAQGSKVDVSCKRIENAEQQNFPAEVITQAHKSWIQVSVRDYGPGVPADELDAVWERFHKSDKARQRTESGAGLGLAIAREIIIAHGGFVRSENVAPTGACFSFFLPLDEEPVA